VSVQRLRTADLVQLGAAVVLAVTLFLPWYSTDPANPNANVDGHRGDVSAWTAHPVLRWFLLAAVAAAVLSAWQTISGQQPSQGFHRGETSVVVAAIVVVLVAYQGWIDRPGDPPAAIDLAVGWYLAFVASLVALGAAIARLPAMARRPPGV
jgi:F0F1-type ATP synthase assembly protein I